MQRDSTRSGQPRWRAWLHVALGSLLAAALAGCGSLGSVAPEAEAVRAAPAAASAPTAKPPVPTLPPPPRPGAAPPVVLPPPSLPSPPPPEPKAVTPTPVRPAEPSGPRPPAKAASRARPAAEAPTSEAEPPPNKSAPNTNAASAAQVAEVHYVPVALREKQDLTAELWLSARLSPEALTQRFTDKYQQAASRARARAVKAGGDAGAAGNFDPTLVATNRYEALKGDVSVQLVGLNGLEVSPKEPIKQSLNGIDIAKWSWRVTATSAPKDGKASVNFLIFSEAGGQRQQIDSITEEITIQAAPVSLYDRAYKFLEEINKWLALFGIGGVGGLYALYQKYKSGGTA